MSGAVQMNTRIEPGLKARGDAALAQAGFSPSQAVRALWTLAANHIDEPDAIQQMLRVGGNADVQSEKAERLATIKRGLSICDEFVSTYCVDSNPYDSPRNEPTFDELRELAFSERLNERGLA